MKVNITEIMTFNLGCRPSARLFALDHRLVVLDKPPFSKQPWATSQFHLLTFQKQRIKFINFQVAKHTIEAAGTVKIYCIYMMAKPNFH